MREPIHSKRSGLRRVLGAVTAGLAIAGTTVVLTSTAASAGTCGQTFNPSIDGAAAHWTLTCSGGNITMTGWVDDTKADGKCAYVTGQFSNATYSAKNCPADSARTNFSWTGSGSLANGYLSIA